MKKFCCCSCWAKSGEATIASRDFAVDRHNVVLKRLARAGANTRSRLIELIERVGADTTDKGCAPASVQSGTEVSLEEGRLLRGRDNVVGSGRPRGVVGLALEIGEEEELVLDDGAADGAAKLVPLQYGTRQCRRVVYPDEVGVGLVLPAVGIENRVAEVLEGASMELIGAGLGCLDDDAADVVAEIFAGALLVR